MKNLVKLKVILLVFLILFASQSIAADRILPIPKPTVDQEAKITAAKKKEIYPQKKPRTEKITVEESQEEIVAIQETKEEVFIYPEKKPLAFKKKIDKAVAKSKILSKSDFKIAKAAFKAIDKKKWQTAIKLSKKAKDKMVFKTVNWLYLIKPNNAASFSSVNFDKSKLSIISI